MCPLLYLDLESARQVEFRTIHDALTTKLWFLSGLMDRILEPAEQAPPVKRRPQDNEEVTPDLVR